MNACAERGMVGGCSRLVFALNLATPFAVVEKEFGYFVPSFLPSSKIHKYLSHGI
jgi:hypothetical protein